MKQRYGKKGQAAIEFMVCVVVILFFLMMVLSLSMTFVVSEYLDYATFMAARTYKAAGGDESDQQQRAREVFGKYAANVEGIARNMRLNFSKVGDGPTASQGVVSGYDIDLFYLPPVFLKQVQIPSSLHLTSEAYLGREVGVKECKNFFANWVRKFRVPNMDALSDEMEDNGC